MYSRIAKSLLVVTGSVALAGNPTLDPAAPGISPDEIQVLTSVYYWQRELHGVDSSARKSPEKPETQMVCFG